MLVVAGKSGEDLSTTETIIELEAKEFLGLRHPLALQHGGDTDVDLLKVIEGDLLIDWIHR